MLSLESLIPRLRDEKVGKVWTTYLVENWRASKLETRLRLAENGKTEFRIFQNQDSNYQ
jgi:hypothetical protein